MTLQIPDEGLVYWVAGFYEGEGNIHCQLSRASPRIMWTIPQKEEEPLRQVMRWLDSIGCERHTLYYKVNRAACNIYEVRTCYYPDALKIFNRLRTLISQRRRDQFDDQLDFFLEHSVKYGTKASLRI